MVVPAQTLRLPVRGFPINRPKALVVALAAWAGFGLVTWAVLSGHTAAIDRSALLFWRDSDLRPNGPVKLLETVRDVTALGGVLLRNLFALGAVVALLFLRLRREASLLTLTITLGWLVEALIKGLVGRDRPEIALHLTEAGGASFPSGHSFNSAVVYMSIALAFAALSRRRKVRLTIVLSAILGSLAVAWSRVWLGVHWPSDALAGWLGGTAWTFSAAALLRPAADAAADATAQPVSAPDSP
ncbi:phosphatase PAP2 family protein [Novosphingobium profundi]|nr:phosphatase PAP2 family protein [Novosphingobium profundi]MBT0668429.1 phosphatase PAP2 family protein [Novosphingobium profundi]